MGLQFLWGPLLGTADQWAWSSCNLQLNSHVQVVFFTACCSSHCGLYSRTGPLLQDLISGEGSKELSIGSKCKEHPKNSVS
jgi:hypothetical protein